jgi:predicted nucleic acid-binding Zn ribbon protein
MKVCVSCEKDVSGKAAVPVKEDRIIKAIRAIKKALRIAQNNELYVCSDCLEKHAQKRKSFERTMLIAALLAALLAVLVMLSPILSGRFDPVAFISGIVLALFILTLPVYFKYAPAAEVAAGGGMPAPSMVARTAKSGKGAPATARKKAQKGKTKR